MIIYRYQYQTDLAKDLPMATLADALAVAAADAARTAYDPVSIYRDGEIVWSSADHGNAVLDELAALAKHAVGGRVRFVKEAGPHRGWSCHVVTADGQVDSDTTCASPLDAARQVRARLARAKAFVGLMDSAEDFLAERLRKISSSKSGLVQGDGRPT